MEERGSLWYNVLCGKYGKEWGGVGGGGGLRVVAKLESY